MHALFAVLVLLRVAVAAMVTTAFVIVIGMSSIAALNAVLQAVPEEVWLWPGS